MKKGGRKKDKTENKIHQTRVHFTGDIFGMIYFHDFSELKETCANESGRLFIIFCEAHTSLSCSSGRLLIQMRVWIKPEASVYT